MAWVTKWIDECVIFMFDKFKFCTHALCHFFDRVTMEFKSCTLGGPALENSASNTYPPTCIAECKLVKYP